MDVLEYYTPTVDWQRFRQGGVSDDVWQQFCNVVKLCQAYKHWQGAVAAIRRGGMGTSLYSESKYQRRKRKDEWQGEIRRAEGHQMRAAFLAAERLWKILELVQGRAGSVDQGLSIALMQAVDLKAILNTMTGHERANFDVLAFDSFDADAEFAGGKTAVAVATKWRAAVGHSTAVCA